MRDEGWESRLFAVIEAARSRPYVLGEFDCFAFACQVVHALTGVDRWPEFAGTYTTKAEALQRIAAHGSSFTSAATWFFGEAAQKRPVYAKRGDIVAYRDVTGEFHLGIVIGTHFLVMHAEGLREVELSEALACWGVGDA